MSDAAPATLALVVVAVAVAATLAAALGVAGLPAPEGAAGWAPVAAGVVLGATAWAVIGIAVAALLPSGNPMGAGSMVAQAAIMVVVFFSANLQPVAELPDLARAVVQALPAYWSGHLVRQGLLGDGAGGDGLRWGMAHGGRDRGPGGMDLGRWAAGRLAAAPGHATG